VIAELFVTRYRKVIYLEAIFPRHFVSGCLLILPANGGTANAELLEQLAGVSNNH